MSLDPITWRAARVLFEEVCELPPVQAEAALSRHGLETAVVELVRRLLRAERSERLEQAADALRDLPAAAFDPPLDAQCVSGQRLGPWRLGAQIGAGGMGTVFSASRDDGEYDGEVAVKFMGEGGTSARFAVEKRALARLLHPGIARILDAGSQPPWGPYLIMERVDGVAIDAYCQHAGLDHRGCIRLLLAILGAVGHAHAQLVLHRDLKPSNILVTADGRPVLLDFGLARLLQHDGSTDATVQRGYTPRYAAPEQLADEPLGVPADLFSLAVLLYELLAGVHPFLSGESSDLGTLMVRVLDGNPTPLRRALAQAGGARRVGPGGSLGAAATRDLEAVLAQALQRQPGDRFQSAAAFADELRRVLDDRPVHARAPSRWMRGARFTRRHWPAAAALTVGALSLLLGAGFAWSYAREAERQRDAAVDSARRAEQLAGVLVDAFAAPNPKRSHGDPLSARDVLDHSAERIAADPALLPDPALAASLEAVIAETYRSIGALQQSQQVYERALQRIGGLDAPEIEGRLLAGLGWVRAYQSDWAGSEALLRRAVDLLAGTDAIALRIESLCRLANPMLNQERFAEAEAVLHEGVALARRRLGAGSTPGLACASTLAAAYMLQGRHAEAEHQYLGIVALDGRDNASSAVIGGARSNLGGVQLRQGRFAEAAGSYRSAIAALSALRGADDPSVALARLGHAQALRGSGSRALARAEYAAATAAYAQWFDEDNDALAYARLLQAEFLYLDGSAAEALDALGTAGATLLRVQGAESVQRCRAAVLQRGIDASLGRIAHAGAGDAADPEALLACLSAEGAPPTGRALAMVVDAEWALAAAGPDFPGRLQRAEAVVRALPFDDPLLRLRLQALRQHLPGAVR